MRYQVSTVIVSLLTLIVAAMVAMPLSMAQEESTTASDVNPPSLRGLSPAERQAAFQAMTDEEKEAIRKRVREANQKQRAEWQAMTPAERETRREEMRELEAQMTPEQRAELEERRERRQNTAKSRSNQPRQQQKIEPVPKNDPE